MSFDSYKFNDDSEPRAKKKIRKNDDDDEEWMIDYNYFSRSKANIKTRNKNISKKEIYLEQIQSDDVFNLCIQHPRLLEYLDLNNYYDIYDYVKYCNKRGVLLEVPIKQHFGEIIVIPNYNIHQKQKIHEQNHDQRCIQGLSEDIKRLKISASEKAQEEQKEIITKYYDIAAVQEELQRALKNREEQRRQQLQGRNLRDIDKQIRQQKQQNNRRAEALKQLYEEIPLDQPINEQTIKNCILEFLQFNREVVEQFQPRVVQRNNYARDEIDYDSLSEDSLEEICAIHPKERKNFTTLNFTRRIQIIRIVPVFSRIKDSTLE